jgi:hypothetical protein
MAWARRSGWRPDSDGSDGDGRHGDDAREVTVTRRRLAAATGMWPAASSRKWDHWRWSQQAAAWQPPQAPGRPRARGPDQLDDCTCGVLPLMGGLGQAHHDATERRRRAQQKEAPAVHATAAPVRDHAARGPHVHPKRRVVVNSPVDYYTTPSRLRVRPGHVRAEKARERSSYFAPSRRRRYGIVRSAERLVFCPSSSNLLSRALLV